MASTRQRRIFRNLWREYSFEGIQILGSNISSNNSEWFAALCNNPHRCRRSLEIMFVSSSNGKNLNNSAINRNLWFEDMNFNHYVRTTVVTVGNKGLKIYLDL